jgi:hypothetical protein
MGGTADELTKGCKRCMMAYVIFVLAVVAVIFYIGIRAQRKLKAIAAADDEEKQKHLVKQVQCLVNVSCTDITVKYSNYKTVSY